MPKGHYIRRHAYKPAEPCPEVFRGMPCTYNRGIVNHRGVEDRSADSRLRLVVSLHGNKYWEWTTKGWARALRAKVLLFKPNGKYYTEEEWEVPEGALGPADMKKSPNFRRIDGGPVLVESDTWGFPALLVKYIVDDRDM
jgi:hypothetical protein